MNFVRLPFAAALTLAALTAFPAFAQTPAAAPAAPPSASEAPPSKPAPRPLNPTELRDSATPPGDLRPEDRVTPQIAIPLGKKPVAPLKLQTRPARGKPAATGGINDASARCEAEVDAQARAACRDKLAHTTPGR